jgi:hypothetical protein
MNRGDEMAANIETGERQSASGAAGSDDVCASLMSGLRTGLKDLERTNNQRKPAEDLHGSDDKLNEQLTDFRGVSLQPKPVQDLDSLIPRISDRLGDETSDVRAMESRTKKRSSRGFARFLVAICIGVAGTLAWQSYGEATKRIIATSAPELGWSPEVKQMIASLVQQPGWTKPPAGPENTAVELSVPKTPQATPASQAGLETVARTSNAPAAPSLDQQQVQQMEANIAAVKQAVEQRLAAVRATVEQLAVGQDQVLREIATLHQEIANKVPASPPPPPIAAAPAVAGRPPGGAPSSKNTQNTAPTSAGLPVGHDVTEVALRASCGPDVQRLCRGISSENSGVIKCLSSHRTELSPTCDLYFKEMPLRRAAETKPKPVTPSSSRAPVPPYIPPHP